MRGAINKKEVEKLAREQWELERVREILRESPQRLSTKIEKSRTESRLGGWGSKKEWHNVNDFER